MKGVIESNFKTCHNLYSRHDLYSGKPIFTQALMIWLVQVSQKTIRSSKKEYAMWVNFRFWPMKNILQIYRELLFLVTFFQFPSNLWEVSCLSWQKLNSKITCHIKLKFFLWTKLLENLLLVKCLTSFEILQLQAKFQTVIVSRSRFIWITNSNDHRRVSTANLLHTK